MKSSLQVLDYLDELRDHINMRRPQYMIMQDRGNWHQLCSALDLVTDTIHATRSYVELEFPEDTGQRHLLLYGLLQALFLQQDGLRHIAQALGVQIQFPRTLRQIRDIRNDAIGHPSKRGLGQGQQSSHFINGMSISKRSFQIMTARSNKSGHEFRDFDPVAMVHMQACWVNRFMQYLLQEIAAREEQHRVRFAETKIVDFLPDTMEDHYGDLLKSVVTTCPVSRNRARAHAWALLDAYVALESELVRRGELPASEWASFHLEQVVSPLRSLIEFFDSKADMIEWRDDALLLAGSARENHKQVRLVALHFDAEYRPDHGPAGQKR